MQNLKSDSRCLCYTQLNDFCRPVDELPLNDDQLGNGTLSTIEEVDSDDENTENIATLTDL